MEEKIKKRVLILTPFFSPNIGGVETHLDDLIKYLQKNNYYTYVLTYQPLTTKTEGLSWEKRKNLEIRRINWFGNNLFLRFEQKHPIFNFLYLTPYLLLHSFLFMLTNHKKVDVIHAFGLNASFMAVILKKFFHKRAVMSTMALYNFHSKTIFSRITTWVLNSLDKVLAESQESKDELLKIDVVKEKIVLFSHWVDQNKFRPENKKMAKKRFGWENKFIVLFVGRAIPIKGGGIIAKIVAKINPKIHFAIISGAGPQVELFQKTSEKYRNFIFLGAVPYEKLHYYYKAADIFVIPSRYEEGAARVMMEALSCGIPVVASRRGAIPSILDSSVAIFVEPNSNEIQKALEFLYSYPLERKNLTKNCRFFAIKNFGFKNAKIIVKAYE